MFVLNFRFVIKFSVYPLEEDLVRFSLILLDRYISFIFNYYISVPRLNNKTELTYKETHIRDLCHFSISALVLVTQQDKPTI